MTDQTDTEITEPANQERRFRVGEGGSVISRDGNWQIQEWVNRWPDLDEELQMRGVLSAIGVALVFPWCSHRNHRLKFRGPAIKDGPGGPVADTDRYGFSCMCGANTRVQTRLPDTIVLPDVEPSASDEARLSQKG